MRTQDPGHHFWLQNYAPKEGDWPQWVEQDVQFFKRIGEVYPGNEGKPEDGTNCQEVIRVLIARVKYLNNQKSCWQNAISLWALRLTLFMFEYRAHRRRGNFLGYIRNIENEEPCLVCGHIRCRKHK